MVLVNFLRYPDPYQWFPDTDPYGSGSETLKLCFTTLSLYPSLLVDDAANNL